MRETRDYLTDDCDLNKNRLELYQGENGDWYISTLKEGQRLGNVVRITTSGGGEYGGRVAMAIYNLYEALKRNERDEITNRMKMEVRI